MAFDLLYAARTLYALTARHTDAFCKWAISVLFDNCSFSALTATCTSVFYFTLGQKGRIEEQVYKPAKCTITSSNLHLYS